MTHKLTSTQPEPVRQKIYGSRPVEPLEGASNQPTVLTHTRVYGVKRVPQIRVRLKADKDKRELLIPLADFDPEKHVAVKA